MPDFTLTVTRVSKKTMTGGRSRQPSDNLLERNTQMKQDKKRDEFDLLDPEIVQAVPNLHDVDGPGKPIHEAARLAQRLEADRKVILAKLRLCSADSPMGPGTVTRFDPETDGHALLAGTDVSTLVAPIQESERSSLLRQLRAVEAALPEAKDRVGEIESRIVVEQSELLRPIAQEIIEDVTSAAQTLLDCLAVESQFFNLITKRGFHGGKRPAFLHFWPQESAWLGGDNGRPCLAYYIKTRCESAGIPAPEERK
jgi:hypothetical protein